MRRLSFVPTCRLCRLRQHQRTYPPVSTGGSSRWTGFYLGAHLGGTWGSSTATDSSSATSLNDYWSAAPSALVAGTQLGYNWQMAPVV
jgi:outer membrane immunogenic protein